MTRLAAFVLLAAVSSLCSALPIPGVSPEEKLVRRLMVGQPTFAAHAFAADQFPALTAPTLPEDVAKTVGGLTTSAAFHDRTGAVAKQPSEPGPYFAVVTTTVKERPPMTRYHTLFRLHAEPAADWKFDPARPAELAKLAGVDAGLVEKQAKLAADVCKDRPFSQLAADPRFARLLAGLALMPKAEGKVTRLDDAMAHERQAWVTLRRRLTGLEKEFPKPFDGPAVMEGRAAPVVREGTEAEAGVKPGTAAKIDAALAEWAADDDQAFAVCVVRRGVIVLHKAYGTRDGKPMTVDTPSWMASVTKPMSASLMLMLADRGLVKLDDPVEKFVPALRGLKAPKPLLVRHLDTHTNGLERWPAGDDTLNDLEYRVADHYHLLKVGKTWAYNGGGYALAGKIIENVSGEAVPLFYKRHLLGPLGCTGTEVSGTHADAFSVPLDMAKFGQMLLNRGAYGKYRFFTPGTFALMLPRKLTEELGPDATKVFGFGLDGRPERFGHGAASAATFSVDVDRELVVIMTRNAQGKNQGKYNGKFWDAINAGIEK